MTGPPAEMPEENTAGAKARVDFAAFAARLKSCPDAYGGSDRSLSAACKAQALLNSSGGTTEVVP